MKPFEVRHGVEVDFSGGLVLIDMGRILRQLRQVDDISVRYDLAFAILHGLDAFAEVHQADPSTIPTPSTN